ncbi:MAG: glycosyltransferase family 4 protein [Actinomycetota bacterium]|nr:glycosyltransferase family 4 protein [Actinomycetota bacterium]
MREVPWGFNIFGYVTGTFGQAWVTRTLMRVMDARDVPMCYRDMSVYDSRATTDPEYPDRECRGREMPYAVNLFSANPPACMLRMCIQWATLRPEKRFNAILPFWELPVLPEDWKRGLRMMDVVLAPSEFIAQTIAAEAPEVPIIRFPQAVFLPDDIAADRGRWGFAPDSVVFLCAFDVTSDIERKNPWGAIEAFERAFEPDSGPQLVIKLNSRDAGPEHQPLLNRLRDLVSRRADVSIIEEQLPYRGLLELYASCDALISLHRAEGLGLVLMEAMSLGKPVICTGWSGNMDFTSEENSCLVPYTLVPVTATHDAYRSEGFSRQPEWAEPDVDAAADWMRRLSEEPELRASLGERAAREMRIVRAQYEAAESLDKLKTFYEQRQRWEPAHAARAAAIRSTRRSGWAKLARRVPRAVWARAWKAVQRA